MGGVQPLYNTDGETVTQGITGLAERCKKYYAGGARFAKWRAVCRIKDSGAPTQLAIDQNAETLARYGAICQANGLVPIIEPEVLMDGKHDILRSAEATQRVQAAVVYAMQRHKLLLEGILLKPNMVRPGASAKPVSAATVARATVRVAAAYSPRCCAWSPLPVGWHDGGIRDGMPQRDEQIEAGRTAVESVLLVRPRSATKLLEGVPWQEGECRGGAGTASDPREGKWFGHARQIRRRCQRQCRCRGLPTRGRLCLLRA